MDQTSNAHGARAWPLRAVPPELSDRYRRNGWWSDDSVGQMLARGLAAKPDAEVVVHSKVRPWRGATGEVDRAARSFAGWLRSEGVAPGDVLVFQLPNWIEAAVAFWGAAYAGAVVVPVVHFYGARELEHIVHVTEPAVVITADRFGSLEYLDAYRSLLGESDARWLVVGDTAAGDLPAGARPFAVALEAEPVSAPAPVDPDWPALVAFTSGTTRDPKGVIHSHRTIGFEARQIRTLGPGEDGAKPNIVGAPVGHFMGMLGALLSSTLGPHPVHLIDVWDPAEVLRVMLQERLCMSGGSTYFVTSLLDHPTFTDDHLALMPYAGMGGSAVPVAVTERATALGIEVHRSYGSTECPSATGATLADPRAKRLRTDGRPLLGVELRLDDEGQILLRAPELFVGYTDPDLTARSFDEGGWYRTGDIGVVDGDGYLTITDRTSDVIIRGGENISAQEVEELLLGMAGVAEVSVVAAPDERLGEHAAAILRMRDGVAPPTVEDVRAHLAAAGLAKPKWPESLYEVGELPRTPSGKVKKFALRQQVRDGALEPNRIP